MATLQDLFTGGYDATLWDLSNQDATFIAVNQVNNQIEVVNASSLGTAGLVSKSTYDMDGSISISNMSAVATRNDREFSIYVCPTKVINTHPFSEPEFYRISLGGGTATAGKMVGGVFTGIASVASLTLPTTLKIEFSPTGNAVRFLANGVEFASELTSILTSTVNYLSLFAYVDSGIQEVHFDTFNATYKAAGASITVSDPTAQRGQTNYKFTLSGGGATAGTATINGQPIAITTYNANGVNTCTIPSNIASLHGTQTLQFTDSVAGTPTASVDLQPAAGYTYTTTVAPLDLTAASVYTGYNGQAPQAGQQITYKPALSPNSEVFTVNTDSSWSVLPAVTVASTTQVFIVDVDGSVGTEQTFTLSVGGGGSYLTPTFGLGKLIRKRRT